MLRLLSLLFCKLLCFSSSQAGVVSKHGRLQVNGSHVTNEKGEKVSLGGSSLYWSHWSAGSKFYNQSAVSHLAQQWNASIVRAAIAVEKKTGYINKPSEQLKLLDSVIQTAVTEDIYVIIDWHTHKAEKYPQQAEEFFSRMAKKYGHHPHVIYEIFNEPIQQDWAEVKAYAEPIIQAIRMHDPDNLIIVGTPFYSQRVVDAAKSPLLDKNLAYTLHFYTGTHQQKLRDTALQAMELGAPLFVTEWGITKADGDGGVYAEEARRWMKFLRQNGISHCHWSIADLKEDSASVLHKAGLEGLLKNQLTPAGIFYRKNLHDCSEK
ncbi:endoglucanase Z [Rubritalea halochordaticola]|uniref:Endoglucanase Z n=1 Tax=Rubritalea halochordaticola TaxID=714537 RepID=A0ABP9UWZ3_9BACT